MADEQMGQSIISLLGLEGLSDEKKSALIAQVSTVVEKRVISQMLQDLPEEAKEQVAKFVSGDSSVDLSNLAEEHNLDMASYVDNALRQTVNEMKQVLAGIDAK